MEPEGNCNIPKNKTLEDIRVGKAGENVNCILKGYIYF